MDRIEVRAKGLGQILCAIPCVMFVLALMYLFGVESPLRERRQAEFLAQARAKSAQQETPATINLTGMTPKQIEAKYNVKNGQATVKGQPYVLYENTLWRIDSNW